MTRIILPTALALLLSSVCIAGLPQPLGWVSDFAGLLDEDSRNTITSVLETIKAGTGAEIAVITQNSLDEFGSIEEMALAYLEGWKLGEKGKDNGIVLLVVVDQSIGFKAYRFETGYGLEGDLPDGLLGEIGREELVPQFREKDFGGGILSAVVRIGHVLGADLNTVTPKKDHRRRQGLGSLIFLLFFILLMLSGRRGRSGLLWLFLLGAMSGSRRGGGFGGNFGGGFGGFGGGGGGGGGGATGSW